MTTLNHLVFDIKNIIYGGVTPDDASISDRQIAFWINETRALLIRQELSQRVVMHDSYIQDIIVTLSEVDVTEACGVDSGCTVLKSTQAIPTTIRRNSKNTILAVQSLDEKVGYSETTSFRRKFNKYNKYTGSKWRWYLKNDFLYLEAEKGVTQIKLSAVFEDPTEAAEFLTCEGNLCFTWDDKYPISLDMATKITDIIIKTKVSIMAQDIKGDDTNDAKDAKEAN